MYTIILSGNGDTEISIVEKDVWEFMHDAKPLSEEKLNKVTAKYRDDEKQETLDWYRDLLADSSTPNDRAFFGLNATDEDKIFRSLKDYTNFVALNNIMVEDSFEGVIY